MVDLRASDGAQYHAANAAHKCQQMVLSDQSSYSQQM